MTVREFNNFHKIVLVIAYLAYFCATLPVPETHNQWWCDPCGQNASHKKRHQRETPKLTAAKSACVNYEEDLQHYVQKVGKHVNKSQINMMWLPKNPSAKKHELYKQMVTYAVTLEELKNIKVDTHDSDFNKNERDKNLTRAIEFHKILLCEIRSNMKEGKCNDVEMSTLTVDKLNVTIPKRTDATAVYMEDYGVLKSYATFLKKYINKENRKLHRNKNRKNKNKDEKNAGTRLQKKERKRANRKQRENGNKKNNKNKND